MTTQARKTTTARESEQMVGEERRSTTLTARGKDINAAIDDLLDEIDEVLEENAEEFVAGYVQRGGE
jgi:ubiquitin-like protein Pup